ncbi:putative pseudouridine synthase, catalytic domain superfamily, tRNA pseudouridine synthase Pus10 [Plasmopara halstedii]
MMVCNAGLTINHNWSKLVSYFSKLLLQWPSFDWINMKLSSALWDGVLTPEALLPVVGLEICIRCCLRFAGIDKLEVYACSEEDLTDAINTFIQERGALNAVPQNAACCSCCVGVLNDAFFGGILANVQRMSENSGYDVKTFSISIKLPSVVLLREYSLLQFLRFNFDQIPRKIPLDIKDVLKSAMAPSISRMLNNAVCINKSEFVVLVDIKHGESADEVLQIPAIKTQLKGNRKRGRGPPTVFDGFGAVSRALAALAIMPKSIISPPKQLITKPEAVVKLERGSVCMQGRYVKFQRGLSQTPWVIDGERMGSSSVEECIGNIALAYFQGVSYKFHTAGREDVDVRMLGRGRPFILEILDAKRAYLNHAEYEQIQNAVNDANDGAVKIIDVKGCTKDCFVKLQAGAESKKKKYCCVVWSKNDLTPNVVSSIDAIQDLTIQQQTPIRVLHRRTLLTRPKVIHTAKCEILNKHYMLLRLTTSAGTYVKEFVHGDRGRTHPNVSSILGCDADIIQLDVEELIGG